LPVVEESFFVTKSNEIGKSEDNANENESKGDEIYGKCIHVFVFGSKFEGYASLFCDTLVIY
jgi:hypothetical protein|tara:strand:- start:103 stop:288 length:186 start_codon:yes stop_codon:yes gene_type:complete